MSKYRKILVTVLSALLIVVAALGIAACNKDKTEYYKIDTVCEAAQGEITVTAPKAKEGYVKDEEVTATVTAKTGYTLDAFTVNGTAAQLTEGKYTFKVQGDTTLKATFTSDAPATFTVTVTEGEGGSVTLSPEGTKNGNVYTFNKDTAVTVTVTPDALKVVDSFKVDGAEKTLTADNTYSLTVTANTTIAATFKYQAASTNALILDDEYFGTYVCYGVDDQPDPDVPSLVVCPIGVFWGDSEMLLSEDDGGMETFWTVDIVGSDEEGTWVLSYDGNGYMSLQFNSDDHMTYYSYSFKTDDVTYRINLNYDDTLGTVTLDPNKKVYEPNEEVTVTVTANSGYVVLSVVVGDGSFNSETVHLESDGTYTFNITQDTTISVEYALDSIPTEWRFIDTWKNLADAADTFVVTAQGATWQGKNYPLVSAQEGMGVYFIQFDIEGAGEIQYVPDTNAFRLDLEDEEGVTTYVFVRGNGDAIFEDEPYCTAGTYTGMEADETLVIDSNRKIKIDGSDVAVYFDGSQYWLYHTKLYTLWFSSGYVTLRAADESGEIRYTADEVGEIPADLVGEWTGADDVTLTVAEGGTITWDNEEGYSLRLIGVTSEGGVSFTMVLTKGTKSEIITGSIGCVSSDEKTPTVLDALQIRIDISAFVDFETADPTELVTEYVFTKTMTKLTTVPRLENGTYENGAYFMEPGTFKSIEVSANDIKAVEEEWDYSSDDDPTRITIKHDVYFAGELENGSYVVYINGSRYVAYVDNDGRSIELNNEYGEQTYSRGTSTETTPTEPAE